MAWCSGMGHGGGHEPVPEGGGWQSGGWNWHAPQGPVPHSRPDPSMDLLQHLSDYEGPMLGLLQHDPGHMHPVMPSTPTTDNSLGWQGVNALDLTTKPVHVGQPQLTPTLPGEVEAAPPPKKQKPSRRPGRRTTRRPYLPRPTDAIAIVIEPTGGSPPQSSPGTVSGRAAHCGQAMVNQRVEGLYGHQNEVARVSMFATTPLMSMPPTSLSQTNPVLSLALTASTSAATEIPVSTASTTTSAVSTTMSAVSTTTSSVSTTTISMSTTTASISTNTLSISTHAIPISTSIISTAPPPTASLATSTASTSTGNVLTSATSTSSHVTSLIGTWESDTNNGKELGDDLSDSPQHPETSDMEMSGSDESVNDENDISFSGYSMVNRSTNDGKNTPLKPEVGRKFLSDEVQRYSTMSICLNEIPVILVDDTLYISVLELFKMLGKTKQIKTEGYGFIDGLLMKSEVDLSAAFLKKARKRVWISKPALVVIMEHDACCSRYHKHIAAMMLKELDRPCWQPKQMRKHARVKEDGGTTKQAVSETEDEPEADPSIPICHYVLDLLDQPMELQIRDGRVYAKSKEIIEYLGLKKHRTQNGFSFIDERLAKLGIDDVRSCYLFRGNYRTHMDLYASYVLMRSYDKDKPLLEGLISGLRQLMEAHADTTATVTAKDRSRNADKMLHMIDKTFNGNYRRYLNGMACLIATPKAKENPDVGDVKNLVYLLTRASKLSEHGESVVDRAVETMYRRRLLAEADG